MHAATADEVAELLGERADDSIVERIVALGASTDEISEAIDDLEYEHRYGEERPAVSPRIEDVRTILEELPHPDLLADAASEDDENDDDLSVIEIDENEREAP